MSEQLEGFSDPEPEPSNLIYLSSRQRHRGEHLEQLATQETTETIVTYVRKLTKLEYGKKDTFLYGRPRIFFDASGDRIFLNECHPPITDTINHNASDFYDDHLSPRVVDIDIQPLSVSEGSAYSVTSKNENGRPAYTLNKLSYYIETDPETGLEMQKEVVMPASELEAVELFATLRSLRKAMIERKLAARAFKMARIPARVL